MGRLARFVEVAGQPDRMVYGRSDPNVAGGVADHARRPAALLRSGPALRQTEGLIGSVIGLLGLDLAVPDHSTLSRRAKAMPSTVVG
jgi:hypothetical protein